MRRAALQRYAAGCGRLAFGGFLALVAGAGGAKVPPPDPGQAPPTVLALLDYSCDLCDELAGKVLARWRGDSPRELAQVRDYLVNHQLSELASARAAGDVTGSLLPRARAEAGAETATSLDRLAGLVRELCDTVAWPTGEREDFAGSVRRILDRIESEDDELGRLLVVTDDARRAALEPYLTAIQLAAVEAQSEYLDYLESLKPENRGPTVAELMQVWHRRYSAATGPTKEALGKVLAARDKNDHRATAGACRELLGAVIPVLRDKSNFELPARRVPASRGIALQTYEPLKVAYHEIRELAVDCSAGRSREVLAHLDEMQKQLSVAAQHLAKYSLSP